jgi:transcription initiation factor TFIIIB Brf1 subunit/transcription initiation factor TFIIB
MGNNEDIRSISECPDCASQNIVHSTMRDQIICRDCGLVFEPLAPTKPAPKVAKAHVKKAAAKKKPAKKAAKKAKPKVSRKAKPAKKAKPGKKRRFGWW